MLAFAAAACYAFGRPLFAPLGDAMCGIAGFFDPAVPTAPDGLNALAAAMGDPLRHRGPDAGAVWTDADAGIALAHRRLAIIDLSPAGHQPMISADGRWVIAYNGEVYNAPELRDALTQDGAKVAWRGHSDTEVIVEAVAHWGVVPAVERLIGMFAFALWDRTERRLFLVRDRLGIKPLYWGRFGALLLFGSELKALRAHPAWTPEIDRDALAAYLRYNYVPAPHTIYRGVHKLTPGTVLTVAAGAEPHCTPYWRMDEVVRRGQKERWHALSDAEAIERLEALLSDAIGRRMVADVPLGAFLSGGVDSSTVTALMQAQSNRPVRTFSIGFREAGYDEAHHAAAVARHLGTDHTELYVEPDHALDVIPRLPGWYDEPFADVSQIPTFLVSEMTRQHVTVALSGDGGDELFAGYSRYVLAETLWRRLGRLPPGARQGAAALIRALPPAAWQRLFAAVPRRWRPFAAGDRLHKLADILVLPSQEALYRRLVSHWPDPATVVRGATEPQGPLWDAARRASVPDATEWMQYIDTLTYLPDDILTKVDRASMAVSLEARVPLLDHRLVELAWHLPMRFKVRDGVGKWLLRQVLYRHVPQNLMERPKMGFGVPIESWLRGPLRAWAEDLLDPVRMRQEGFLDPDPVHAKWREHLSGRRNWHYSLWGILMFQAWLRYYHASVGPE